MCVTFFIQHAMQSGVDFPFVIAFNRDEQIGR
jgi:uncharacterized protein with NRDE domain